MHKTPLYDKKIGFWCAISRSRIISPIFFTETINSDRYINDVLKLFLTKLSDTDKRIGCFQQDGATAHTLNASLTFLQTIFGSRIISKNLWPPRSPDRTSPDFDTVLKDVFRNMMTRATRYTEAGGDHFQHLL